MSRHHSLTYIYVQRCYCARYNVASRRADTSEKMLVFFVSFPRRWGFSASHSRTSRGRAKCNRASRLWISRTVTLSPGGRVGGLRCGSGKTRYRRRQDVNNILDTFERAARGRSRWLIGLVVPTRFVAEKAGRPSMIASAKEAFVCDPCDSLPFVAGCS